LSTGTRSRRWRQALANGRRGARANVVCHGGGGWGRQSRLLEFHPLHGPRAARVGAPGVSRQPRLLPGLEPPSASAPSRTRRAAHRPGNVRAPLTPNEPSTDHPGDAGALDALPATSFLRLIRPARSAPSPRSRRAAARKPGQPLLRSSRTFTGSTLRPRRCSTVWSRAADGPTSCCSSTYPRSISTAGAARPTTPNFGSTHSPARADELLQALSATTQPRTRHRLRSRVRGNPFLSGGERAHPVRPGAGRGPGAYHLDEALDRLQVPVTVQQMLAAQQWTGCRWRRTPVQTAPSWQEVPLPLLESFRAAERDTRRGPRTCRRRVPL